MLILLFVLFLMSLGGYPGWGWHHLGYWPSSVSLLLFLVVLVLVLRGRLD